MERPGRGKNGDYTQTLDTAGRDRDAAQMRGLGHSYAQIAAAMGYANEGGAWKAVQRALAATRSEGTAVARQLEVERLDRWLLRTDQVYERPGPQVDRMGHPVIDPSTGEPYPNRDVQLGAIDRAARLMERRARLLGLDAPKRSVSVIADIPLADIQAALEVLRVQLGLPPGDGAEAPRKMLSGTAEAV